MKIRPEKQQLAELLTQFYLRLQLKEEEIISIRDLAKKMDVTESQLARWMSDTQDIMPRGDGAIKLVNFYIDHFGEEALKIYDVMGWDRPKHPQDAKE